MLRLRLLLNIGERQNRSIILIVSLTLELPLFLLIVIITVTIVLFLVSVYISQTHIILLPWPREIYIKCPLWIMFNTRSSNTLPRLNRVSFTWLFRVDISWRLLSLLERQSLVLRSLIASNCLVLDSDFRFLMMSIRVFDVLSLVLSCSLVTLNLVVHHGRSSIKLRVCFGIRWFSMHNRVIYVVIHELSIRQLISERLHALQCRMRVINSSCSTNSSSYFLFATTILVFLI